MTAPVRAEQRYSRGRRCPVCDGADGDARGSGKRCHGYRSADGEWARCSREECAGLLQLDEASGTYAHRLNGLCKCGEQHGGATSSTAPSSTGRSLSNIAATYDYCDEGGALLFQVVRFAPKGFRQRRPDENGKPDKNGKRWTWNREGVRCVLYRLPELLAAPTDATVYIVEGEKDVETLRALGLVATCNPEGALKWHHVAEHARKILARRHVRVIPDLDADHKGGKHAEAVEASLRGVTASVRIVPLDKHDVSDWVAAGGTAAQLEKLAADTNTASTASERNARTVRLADVKPRRVEWLWQSRIPFKMISLVDGDPGLGKSTMMLDIAARVSRGERMPFDERGAAPADVLLMTAEDTLEETIRPRLDAAGADVTRIHAVVAMPRPDDPDAPPTLAPEDLARLEREIVAHRAALVVVDPLMAFLPAKVDSYRDQDMRRVLTPLARVAERTGAAIVIVRHLRKGEGSALYRGGGSIGISGAARSVLLVAPEPAAEDDEQRDTDVRIVASVKSNLAAKAPALRWRLVDAGGIARVEWIDVADGITADQLAAPPMPSSDADKSTRGRAIAALRDVLADGRQRPASEVNRLVADLTGASHRTIERARADAGVEPVQVRGADGRVERIELRIASTPPSLASGGVDDSQRSKSASRQGNRDHSPHRHGHTATDDWRTGSGADPDADPDAEGSL